MTSSTNLSGGSWPSSDHAGPGVPTSSGNLKGARWEFAAPLCVRDPDLELTSRWEKAARRVPQGLLANSAGHMRVPVELHVLKIPASVGGTHNLFPTSAELSPNPGTRPALSRQLMAAHLPEPPGNSPSNLSGAHFRIPPCAREVYDEAVFTESAKLRE